MEYLTNSSKRYILLSEGARDKALQMFMPLFQQRGLDISISQMKQLLLRKFVNEAGINNLSMESNYYLLGVARYYFEGKLTTNKRLNALYPNIKDRFNGEVCQRLDALILILRNAYIDTIGTQFEQPEDFGNLTLEKLLRKYNKKINKALGLDKKQEEVVEERPVSDDYSAGKNYTYEILYSYNDAKKYKQYTHPGAWCITYGEQHYNGYIRSLGIHYVIFRQNGFENVPRKVGDGFTKKKPHDAYGNSLIAVLQSNSSPKPIYITSRWNHGALEDGTNGTEADHAYTTEEFLNVIGADYSVLERAYEQWKRTAQDEKIQKTSRSEIIQERIGSMRRLKYCQMLINGGKNPLELNDLSYEHIDKSIQDPKMNGAYIVRLDSGEDSSYFTIMDRKKMFIDQIFVKAKWSLCTLTSKKYAIIRISSNNSDMYCIYDQKRHSLLDVDGEYKFKDINHSCKPPTNSNPIQDKYTILAMSGNQVALVKLDTMQPVRAKNGSAWFEGITFVGDSRYTNFEDCQRERGIDLPYTAEGICRLTYDSSAGESYLYNTVTDRFISDDGSDEKCEIIRIESPLLGFCQFKYRVRNSYMTFTRLYDLRTDKFKSIGGYDAFSTIVVFSSSIKKVFALFKPCTDPDAGCLLYSIADDQYVMFNGKPLQTMSVRMFRTGDAAKYFILCDYLSYNGEARYIVINPFNNKIMSPDDTDPFVDEINRCQKSYGNLILVNNQTNQQMVVASADVEYQKELKNINYVSEQFQGMLRRFGGGRYLLNKPIA